MENPGTRRVLIALCTAMAAVFFAIDLMVPLGVALGVPYVIVLIVASRSRLPSAPLAFAGFSTLLIFAGWLASPSGGSLEAALPNRVLTIAILWVLALFFSLRLRAERLQEQAEAKLREQEQRLRGILEALPAAVYTCDSDGHITSYNKVATELWGHEPVIGKDKWCGSWRIFTPDGAYLPHDQCPMAVALREARATEGEILVERPDGTRRHIHAYPQPTFAPAGELTGAVNLLVDLSERRRAEESDARLAAIIESSEDAIIGKTLDGTVTSWNRAAERLYGYTADEMIGEPIHRLIPPDHPEELVGIFERLHNGEPIHGLETVRRCKDGSSVQVSLTISPIKNSRGEITGASAIARDITERNRAQQALRESEEALRAADQRKDEFLAALAHELRNPLAPLRTSLEILRLAEDNPAIVADSREVMVRQVEQLTRLVEDLLDIARITHGKLKLQKTRVELTDIVRTSVEAARPQLSAAGHELTVELPDAPMVLDADPMRIAQVLGNLLVNASKYTPRGGHITVRAEAKDGGALVSVVDDGKGIAAEHVDAIFDDFHQLDHSLETGFQGLGLGLTLVRSFVEMHGGTVGVRSEGPDKGSEFRVWLPGMAGDAGPAAEIELGERPHAAGRRVLVVDDKRDTAQSMAKLLEMLGNDVRVAFDGRAALAAASEFRPELVLLDIGLPELNGYEVARRIRAEPWGEDVRLAAVTGWGHERDQQRAKSSGFDDHLTKPLDLDRLHALLDELDARAAGAESR